MKCSRCGTDLEKPGDFCLDCNTANADRVVVDIGTDRATVTMLDEEGAIIGETIVTTVPEEGTERVVERRNYAGKIVDHLRRKRPREVYLSGDRETVSILRSSLRFPLFRIDGDDPVETLRKSIGGESLDVVDVPPMEKVSGRHSTIIGKRTGWSIVQEIARYPHVKKIVPGPIDAGGTGSQTGVRGKVTRADTNGNLRLLITDGSSVQENRIITTASSRDQGEGIRDDLNEHLRESGFQ